MSRVASMTWHIIARKAQKVRFQDKVNRPRCFRVWKTEQLCQIVPVHYFLFIGLSEKGEICNVLADVDSWSEWNWKWGIQMLTMQTVLISGPTATWLVCELRNLSPKWFPNSWHPSRLADCLCKKQLKQLTSVYYNTLWPLLPSLQPHLNINFSPPPTPHSYFCHSSKETIKLYKYLVQIFGQICAVLV